MSSLDGRILVTGGAGFIGSALVWALNQRGHTDIVITDFLGSDEKWKNLVPLRFADYVEAVKLCHELGNDVNAINTMGLTALMGAANRGSDDIIKFLVEKGARLDVKDKEGRTALTWAEGVFLATHPAKPKPSSMALIKSLGGPAGQQ